MTRVIVQPNATDWRVVPVTDGFGRHIGDCMKPYDFEGNEVDWSVQPGSQGLFLNCPIFECLYTGNRGGGKTECLLMDFAQFVGRGFGAAWKGILFRHTYKELQDVVDKSTALFKKIWGNEVKYNQTHMTWTWASGERLIFSYMEHEKDYMSYHGHAYPWIGWEELTSWPDSGCYTRMFSCCRSATPGLPLRVRSTTNPYGSGFNWVKDRFKLPIAPGCLVGELIDDEETGQRVVINSDLRENKVLLTSDPKYIQRIKASARNEAELAAWLHGSWDITSGGMFDDIWFRVREDAVIPPFKIPLKWRIDRSFDWGSSRPFSVGWWATSDGSPIVWPDGRVMHTLPGDIFRVKEWYGCDPKHPNKGIRLTASEIADGIREREKEWGFTGRVRRGVADAAIFDSSNHTGMSIATEMARRHVHFVPSDKSKGSRKLGWEAIREMLSNTVPDDGCPKREYPGLFLTTECGAFLRTVPSLPRDDDDLDDVDSDAEDHVADEVRYKVRAAKRYIRHSRTKGMT